MYLTIKKMVVFFTMMFLGIYANAQFFSLHQYSQAVSDGKGIPVSYTGFRNQFAPTGTPGCVMGITSLRSECTYVSNGLSFSLQGGQNSSQFKVYVPAGVTSFIFSSYLPQGMQAAVAVRMGSAPIRVNPLDAGEYATYQASKNIYTVYERLLAGQEVIMVADGGGSFSLAGNNNFPQPLTTGAWLYFRLINGNYIDTPRATYEIDLPSYIAGYNAITTANGWGTDGDPLEAGATVNPSFSIKLNGTLTQGNSGIVAITPTGDTLKTCSASPVANATSYSNNNITLTPSGTATLVTVSCTGATTGNVATATIPVQAAPSTPFTSFTLSAYSLTSTDTSTVTIIPNLGATLPMSCTALQSDTYLNVVGNAININSKTTQKAQSILIDCGLGVDKRQTLVINLPLVVIPNSTDPTKLTDLTFVFTPILSSGVTSADVYIFVYVPGIPMPEFGIDKTDALYGYQVKNGYTKVNGNWQSVSNQWLPILFTPPEAYQTSVSSGQFTVNLGYGVTGDVAKVVNAEYYVAYLPSGTKDLTKLQFVGDKSGSFIGIPVFWKP